MEMDMDIKRLESLARLLRYYILVSTTRAGSGHPSSSLSAVELMTGLFFGGMFRFKANDPDFPNNDRLVFSKGHASPLFYALWVAAGHVSEEELVAMRTFGSPLEGHPTKAFPYTEAATGSLGQGLSIGVGMAMNAKYLDKLPYRTFVLLGDSEMAEGSQWEAVQLAAHYRLDNLVGILDVNRLGQRGETMYGHDLDAYAARIRAFGWETIQVDGHCLPEIMEGYRKASEIRDRPVMIIARTMKGKGVSSIEDKNGWHGKPLDETMLQKGLDELGNVDMTLRMEPAGPEELLPPALPVEQIDPPQYEPGAKIPTRKAYGNGLVRIFPRFPQMVVLDAEVSNSTYSELFKEKHPERFFEMFVAEQNMVGTALGFSNRDKIPFVSTFAAFLTRAFDQIRMSRYSGANIKFCGSHAGVSIGEDGSSQMGLEDLAMFRTILGSVVLYPSDAVSTERLMEEAAAYEGIVYLRTTRGGTPLLYSPEERFVIGGSKVLRRSSKDVATVIAAGITLHEALAAQEQLEREGVMVRVIDLYSIKPLDLPTLREAARQTRAIVTVEDHFQEGGIGEAVALALTGTGVPVHSLAVRKMPRSGKPNELLHFEDISKDAIINTIREVA
ncbi:MAG: transketolase [Desulfovibrionales bacterium]